MRGRTGYRTVASWAVAVVAAIIGFVLVFSFVASDIYPEYPGPLELIAGVLLGAPDGVIWVIGGLIAGIGGIAAYRRR